MYCTVLHLTNQFTDVAPDGSAADIWMDAIIHRKGKSTPGPIAVQAQQNDEANPYMELEKYLKDPLVSKAQCPELISWWGVNKFVILSLPIAHK